MPTTTIYHELAQRHHAVPIATDLTLKEHPDHEAIVLEGPRLAQVVAETAHRYKTPLAIPLMDLTIEKNAILQALGIPEAQRDTYHFTEPPPQDAVTEAAAALADLRHPRAKATCDAIRHIADHTDLHPIGMCIGPFSLFTKLLSDPITAVYLKGMGLTAEDEPAVGLLDTLLELSVHSLAAYIRRQLEAGARSLIVCEPAANTVYFSPKQIEQGSDIFETCVINPNRRLKDILDAAGVHLVFHDCGELDPHMVRRFADLNPAVLSFGSSRKLWEDAALVPPHIVLYGNMPTKHFYSDELVPLEKVPAMAEDLRRRMAETGHPFILGSECDVLSVPGREQTIKQKVAAFTACDHCLGHDHPH